MAVQKRSAGAPKRGPSSSPSRSTGSSGSHASGGGAARTDGGGTGLDRRAAWLSAALVLAVIFTSLEIFSQHPRTDAFASLKPKDLRWWFTPVELNATRRLPLVEGDLNAIAVAPGTRQVWMVGEGGLVLHSPDGGGTWERQDLAPSGRGSAAAPAAARLAPAADATQVPTLSANPLDAVAALAFLAAPPEGSAGQEKAPRPPPQAQAQAPATGTDASGGGAPAGVGSSGSKPGFEQQTTPSSAAPAAGGATAGAPAASARPKPGVQAAPLLTGQASKAAPGTGKTARPAAPASPPRTPVTAATSAAGTVRVSGTLDEAIADVEDITKANLYAVQFLDAAHGWIAGDHGAVFVTTDGGRWWKRQSVGAPDIEFRSLAFVDPANGWLVGGYAGSARYLFVVSDGKWAMKVRWTLKVLGNGSSLELIRSDARDGGQLLILSGSTIIEPRPDGADRQVADFGEPVAFAHVFNSGAVLAVRGEGVALVQGPGRPALRGLISPSQPIKVLALTGRGDSLAWVVGGAGAIFASTDGGRSWRSQPSGVTADLDAVAFADQRTGWVGGRDGTILATADGGATWVRRSQRFDRRESAFTGHAVMLPAPWYYLSLVLVGFVLAPALRRPLPVELPDPSVADLLISDRPVDEGDADAFDFTAVARGLSRFLRNERTQPPLTLAVTGEWGTGKSSLMNLLRADLKRYGFRPVWFNAWHHQKEEHLLASLLEAVRSQAVPPPWLPGGVRFRWRLLRIRWGRYWPIMVVLLVGAAISAGYVASDPSNAATELGALARAVKALVSSGKPPDDSAQLGKTLTYLGTLAGFAVAIWKGAKGFGVDPASLLARTAARSRVSDLKALTGFRERFAAEFRDVTTALNPRTMLILIDDLDRCKPERVLEVLEAINFLVSSGDCFVILGMARERVVRCVGLGFKDIAEALLDPSPGAVTDETTRQDMARQRQREFAQQYLEKLINIEIPVPTPTSEQSRQLLRGLEPSAPAEPGRRRRESARFVLRRALPVAAMAVLLPGAFWFGFHRGGGGGREERAGSSTSPQLGANGTAAHAARQVAEGATNPQPAVGTATGAPPPGVRGVPAVRPPREVKFAAGEPEEPHNRLLFLLLVMVLAVGLWRLSIRPDVVTRDSQEFDEALSTWHPLIFAKLGTPRHVKRFMNRVRYVAMLQRRDQRDVTLLERALAWIAGLLPKKQAVPLGEAAPEPAGKEQAKPVIPEAILVALSAIEYTHPEWLEDGKLAADPWGVTASAELPAEIVALLAGNTRQKLASYAAQYLKMASGVHMS
jgi:photosystem II stability/assembly factor-like uncharacterized protein